MTPLATALKNKFTSPAEAIAALGLDASLLDDEFRTEGLAMDTVPLGRKAARAKNVIMAVLKPRLAQDARIDLTPIFADVSDRQFAAKLPVITKAIKMTVRGRLAQDEGIEDLEDLLAAVMAEKGEGGPPGESDLDPSSGFPAGGMREGDPDNDEPTENKIVDYLKDKVTPEHLATVADMLRASDRRVDDRRYVDDESEEERERREGEDRRADDARRRLGRDESEEEKEAREEKESAEDARKRLGRDESEEECQDRRARDKRARDVRRAYDAWRRAEDAFDRRRAEDQPAMAHGGPSGTSTSAPPPYDKRADDQLEVGKPPSSPPYDKRADDRKLEEDRRRAAEDLRRARAEDRRHRAEDNVPNSSTPPPPTTGSDRRRKADDKRRAEDEPPPFTGKPEVGKGPPAMDAAAVEATISKRLAERDQEHRLALEAREFVRPIVGTLPMALDSADEIYKSACRARGIKIDGIHPSAYRSLLEMHHKVSQAVPQHHAIAQDAASARSFNERFPEVGRVIVQG